jgi:hypothetical protein
MARSKPGAERHALALKPSTVDAEGTTPGQVRHSSPLPLGLCSCAFAVEVGWPTLAVFARVGFFCAFHFRCI